MAFELMTKIAPVDPLIRPRYRPAPGNPLAALAELPGKWIGKGFNQIWRPFHGSSDRFLELNLTDETLEFSDSIGEIPNRGLLQEDVDLFGLHYLQQIKDSLAGVGLHVEPGLWVVLPTATTNPAEPAGIITRMASIPHGTTINAQGTALEVSGGPVIDPVSIRPFPIGGAPPANTAVAFPPFNEADLAVATAFRLPNPIPASITQAMVNNPNSVLKAAIAGQTITHTTVIFVSTKAPAAPPPPTAPNVGGGTDNIAFLAGGAGGPNADAAKMTAIFWIEHVAAGPHGPAFLQLQYTQTVLLNFNGLSWPHVSVATLRKHT